MAEADPSQLQTYLVLGASGRLGRAVVREILNDPQQKVRIRVGVHSNQLCNVEHEQIEHVNASLENRDELESALEGVNVVICVAAAPRGPSKKSAMGCYFENLMEAMIKKKVMRLVVTSCISALDENLAQLPFGQKQCLFGLHLRGMRKDMRQFEKFIAENRNTRLSFVEEYTIVRLPNLNDKDESERSIITLEDTGRNCLPEGIQWSMPRANAAKFLLDCVRKDSWHRAVIYVGLRSQ